MGNFIVFLAILGGTVGFMYLLIKGSMMLSGSGKSKSKSKDKAVAGADTAAKS